RSSSIASPKVSASAARSPVCSPAPRRRPCLSRPSPRKFTPELPSVRRAMPRGRLHPPQPQHKGASMLKTLSRMALAATLVAGVAIPAQAEGKKPVTIGWTAWSDAEFIAKLAAKVITDRVGEEVKLIQTDIAPQYQGIAKGDIDAMLMAWLPNTHADYWK